MSKAADKYPDLLAWLASLSDDERDLGGVAAFGRWLEAAAPPELVARAMAEVGLARPVRSAPHEPGTIGAWAYREAMVPGRTWRDIAAIVGVRGYADAHNRARLYAEARGLPWPIKAPKIAPNALSDMEQMRRDGRSFAMVGAHGGVSRERARQLVGHISPARPVRESARRRDYEAAMSGESLPSQRRADANEWARKHGLPPIPPPQPVKTLGATIYELRAETRATWAAIAERVGVRDGTVACNAAKQHARRHSLPWPIIQEDP